MAKITIDGLTFNTSDGKFYKKGKQAGGYTDTGYRKIQFRGSRPREHRLAWFFAFGEIPEGMEIDHKNGIRDDNRIGNLRLVTSRENAMNRTKQKNNTSGVTGVTFNPLTQTWRSRVNLDGKKHEIGSFKSKRQAIQAVRESYAKLGFYERHGRKSQV